MNNKIDLETASKVLINNPPDDVDLTIVGGNALDFWVEVYSETFDFVKPYLEMKTRDVDFVIKENASYRACLEHWKTLLHEHVESVDLNVVPIDDSSPEAAHILVTLDNLESAESYLLVDFLFDLAGVSQSDIQKNRVLSHHSKSGRQFILNEYMVLVSRAHNVIKIPSKRTEYGLNQLRAAISINKALMTTLLDSGAKEDIKEAKHIAKKIFLLSKWQALGIPLYKTYDIDLMDAIPEHLNWPEEFTNKGLPNQLEYLSKRRGIKG